MLIRARKINQYLPQDIKDIAKIFGDHNYACYLVGGALRDLLLGCETSDYDLATDALPEKIQELFKDNIPTGKKFGTITIKHNDNQYEITTLRHESSYADGRHPDQVEFTTDIKKDLRRRDFTINALAYNVVTSEMIDEFNGLEDLKMRIIKAVGDPEIRFAEDGLRVLRGIRLMAQTGFALDIRTAEVMAQYVSEWLKLASKERIFNELDLMFNMENPDYGFSFLGFPRVDSLDKQIRWAAVIKERPEVYELVQEKQKRRWIDKLLKYELDVKKASLEVTDLAVDGIDIMELGPRGEEVGRILDSLLELIVYKRSLNRKNILMNYAKDLAQGISVEQIIAEENKKKELSKTSLI